MHLSPEFLTLQGVLGFWQWNFAARSIRTCPGLNRFLGPEMPDRWLDRSVDAFMHHVHPDDRAWMLAEQPQCVGPSGSGMLVYRLLDQAGLTHWVMTRGRYVLDRDGALASGEGVMIDVTAVRADGAGWRVAPAPLPHPLFRFIDAATDAHLAAKQMQDWGLMGQTERMLMTAGRKLAADLAAEARARLLN